MYSLVEIYSVSVLVESQISLLASRLFPIRCDIDERAQANSNTMSQQNISHGRGGNRLILHIHVLQG
jgi:hypothetical protein